MRWGAVRFRSTQLNSGGGGVRIIAHLGDGAAGEVRLNALAVLGHPAGLSPPGEPVLGPASSVQSTSLRAGGCGIPERYSLPAAEARAIAAELVRAAELVEAEGTMSGSRTSSAS